MNFKKILERISESNKISETTLPKGFKLVKEPIPDYMDDTCKEYYVLKKGSKRIGEIYHPDETGDWGCMIFKTEMGWDMIDTKEDAIQQILDEI